MSEHRAEPFTENPRARGVLARDPFAAPKLLRRGLELRRLEELPWPMDVFGKPARISDLMDEAAQLPQHAGDRHKDMCSCGCDREHKRNVSQALRRPRGQGFNVIYFWSEACKRKWNRERMQRLGIRL